MKKTQLLIFTLFVALFTANCSRKDSTGTNSATQALDQSADVTFKTPEEAITYYLEGVSKSDVRKILQACAINEMASKSRFDLHTERLGAMDLQNLSPSEYQFYSEINRIDLSSQFLNQVKHLSYSLLSAEKVDGSMIVPVDAERVKKFIKDVDPQRLSKLELKKISPSNKTVMDSPRYVENVTSGARTLGADEGTERVALFSFDQNYYYLGFTLLRYGGSWKISNQSSPIANTDSLGTPKKTTPEEFEKMIEGQGR